VSIGTRSGALVTVSNSGLHCIALIVLCWTDIGVAALAPLAFIIIFLIPMQYLIARWTSAISGPVTDLITQRVHLMSEILTAVTLNNSDQTYKVLRVGGLLPREGEQDEKERDKRDAQRTGAQDFGVYRRIHCTGCVDLYRVSHVSIHGKPVDTEYCLYTTVFL
jgi:hypothetical protein